MSVCGAAAIDGASDLMDSAPQARAFDADIFPVTDYIADSMARCHEEQVESEHVHGAAVQCGLADDREAGA